MRYEIVKEENESLWSRTNPERVTFVYNLLKKGTVRTAGIECELGL